MRVEEWELEREKQQRRAFLKDVEGRNKPWQEWYYRKQLAMLEDAIILYRLPNHIRK